MRRLPAVAPKRQPPDPEIEARLREFEEIETWAHDVISTGLTPRQIMAVMAQIDAAVRAEIDL